MMQRYLIGHLKRGFQRFLRSSRDPNGEELDGDEEDDA
jgi:hypothetical protein